MAILGELTCPLCRSTLEVPGAGEKLECEICGVEYRLNRHGGINYTFPADLREPGPPGSEPPPVNPNPSFWWITTNPAIWVWNHMFTKASGEEFFRQRTVEEYFEIAKPGDFVFGYSASPNKQLVALAYVKRGYPNNHVRGGILIAKATDSLLPRPVPWGSIVDAIPYSEPVLRNAQGTLFKLTHNEAKELARLIRERGNPTNLYPNLVGVQNTLWDK